MKKVAAVFTTLLMFAFAQASPFQMLQEVNNSILLSELDQNKEVTVMSSEEMPRKRKASRTNRRASRRKIEK
ncbi:MAG: hypothetical protein CMB82_03690 [Flammeovirgaceae bacterium]|nr:hypothetical protein [Flammeovirgaceae bacterium]|tara:strand:- start:7247 stop:7462 length:216 start_codon:yes stop_codon:yes gene_type:complete